MPNPRTCAGTLLLLAFDSAGRRQSLDRFLLDRQVACAKLRLREHAAAVHFPFPRFQFLDSVKELFPCAARTEAARRTRNCKKISTTS